MKNRDLKERNKFKNQAYVLTKLRDYGIYIDSCLERPIETFVLLRHLETVYWGESYLSAYSFKKGVQDLLKEKGIEYDWTKFDLEFKQETLIGDPTLYFIDDTKKNTREELNSLRNLKGKSIYATKINEGLVDALRLENALRPTNINKQTENKQIKTTLWGRIKKIFSF